MQANTGALMALTALTGLATILPTAAPASDLGYTYAEMRYLDADFDTGANANGATGIGWYRLNDRFFAIGQFTSLNLDNDADATTIAAGGGFIQSLGDEWDAVATATFRHNKIETALRDVSHEGYGLQLGFRGMPIPKIEARAFLNYVNVTEGDTSFFLSGDYFFSPTFCAGLAAELGGNADVISFGVRYAFGN
jgi:hypothetical protein